MMRIKREISARLAALRGLVLALLITVVSMTAAPLSHAQNMQQLTKVDIRIAPDLSLDETVRTETTPLVESSVGSASQARWEIPGNQSADLVEAFTRKADGRIIPADLHDIATQDGVVGQAMSFVDLKLQQIPFRDVAVGDTTVLTIRFKESQHYIPGQYSQAWQILPGGAKKSLDVTLRTPASLSLYHDAKDLAYEESRDGGDVVRHWSGSPPHLNVEETNVANLVRVVPSVSFSTFPSYEAIARAYDDGARPMAVVTSEVQRLADEITKDKADVRSQAEAVFNWVSRNIRYVAVYFGRGRYVPNDTQTILSRRFGDCKDHATLLMALLAAKGIASEQTLINLNPTYELAKTATLQSFNHVIVYIPALDLYVDPTVAFGAFSRLPTGDLGKPVVRVSDHGVVVARTPTPSTQDNVVELDTRIVMSADGRRQGQTTVEARGEFVDLLRRFAAQAEQKGRDLALQGLAKQRGFVGEFSLDAPPWTTTSEPYRITTTWETKRPFDLVQAGWRTPVGFSPIVAFPDLFFGTLDRAKRIYPAGCRAGRAVNSVDVALPDDVSADRLPAPVEAKVGDFSYRTRWSAEGHHLQVRTEIVSSVPTRVCGPEQIDAIRAAYRSIEERVSPLLHFSRMDGQHDEVRPVGDGNPNAAAEPGANSPQIGNRPPPASGQAQ
jgi:transglutaminase-like putative cysteine protease